MMNTLKFPAFRSSGKAVQLSEILAVIPENNLVWSIIEFNGTGIAPFDLSMDEFEELVSNKPCGLTLTWNELKRISSGFYQTFDCLIVGAKTNKDISDALTIGDNFYVCDVLLNAFDSTEWSVWARDVELMKQFRAVY
ncbi:MAG: hypothetical protein CENE_02306 [Candidatus Celerinatantimonas neptuna]|nr:MAG: hypothetical protein CENE_02306 [Candidatus Celerinatantimonas neptuna]